jgi:hypothetical protein
MIYVIKFVSDMQQVSGFFSGTPVSSTNKTDGHDISVIIIKYYSFYFFRFQQLCCEAYLIIRKNAYLFINLVTMMVSCGITEL